MIHRIYTILKRDHERSMSTISQ